MTAIAPDPPDVVGRRLKLLRIALGFERNQGGFAAKIGMTSQSWNNYETGRRRPELEKAVIIRARTGVTLDWIYHGDIGGLPVSLAQALDEAEPKARRA